jgi:hypothetical protein
VLTNQLSRTAPTIVDRPRTRTWLWIAVLVLLCAVRLPSLVQPAGGDQGLYVYAAQRILAGDVMYRDMWDQKPPAIAFLYAAVSLVTSREAIVPGADLAAAIAVAGLLVVLGRRSFSPSVGFGAAAIFLLLGDPYLLRLSGIYVRGQCEPFIALAVTASLALLARRERNSAALLAAGVLLAIAFWVKYNALAYGLPAAVATLLWRRGDRSPLAELALVGAGFTAVAAAVLGYFALNGALLDLRLATIDYNLRYSNETYTGPLSMLWYAVTFPSDRARMDMLWFAGGLGALLLAIRARNQSALLVFSWLAAAIISIAVNGSRGLPNYFVQANPVLAFAAAAGLATLATAGTGLRAIVGAALVAALWRVGTDEPVMGFRLAAMPGLVRNVSYDLQYIRGDLDRASYLRRFRGVKHDAFENEALAEHARQTTAPEDRVFVFGFSGGSVGWKSGRASGSRFFWSRPVLIEFAAEHPGYGSRGLLQELQRTRPALVALQKEEWRSAEFFLANASLRAWLADGYMAERETPMFSVWRRKSTAAAAGR